MYDDCGTFCGGGVVRQIHSHENDELNVAGRAIRALSSPARLRILCLLLGGEHSVVELTRMIDNHTQSSVSQHLGFLLKAGLVENRKYKTQMRYRITDQRVRDMIVLVEEIFCGRHRVALSQFAGGLTDTAGG